MKTLGQIGCETFWLLMYPEKTLDQAEAAWNGKSGIDHQTLWNAAAEAIIREHTERMLKPSGGTLAENPTQCVDFLNINRLCSN